MSCFQFSTNPIELLFYGLSLLQAYRGVQLAQIIWRERQDFQQEPLTRRKAALGEQAAFFLAIPPSVALHEFSHALAIWGFGGRVVRCGYGFYWGFVQANQMFPVSQEWFIALAGTLGSLLFGLGLWLVLRQHRSSAVRFFALRSLRTQLFYALIFYPVFSAATFIGDWRTIYNFRLTPFLSGLILVLHGVGLGAMWYGQKQGWFEMEQADSLAEQARLRQWEAAAQANPQDAALQLRYIRALRQSGAARQTSDLLTRFLQNFPQSAEGHLELALLQRQNTASPSRAVLQTLEKAVTLGLHEAPALVTAHSILGEHYLGINPVEAYHHLSQAILAAATLPDSTPNKLPHLAHLYYLRSKANQLQNASPQARADLDEAIDLARRSGRTEQLATYQKHKQFL